MDGNGFDLANRALAVALETVGGRRASDIANGSGGRSAGCVVTHSTLPDYWLKVRIAPTAQINRHLWDGALSAACIDDVSKPRVFGYFDWEANGYSCRALKMSIAPATISKTPRLDGSPVLDPEWWARLKRDLSRIQTRKTGRRRCDDDVVVDHLSGRFGLNLRQPLPMRQTAHGDLHWANLTAPEFAMIDWDCWGEAPFGFDVAHLHVFSMTQKETLAMLKDVFSDVIERPEYDIAFLFLAAFFMEKFELHGKYPRIQSGLRQEAERICGQGRIRAFCA